MAAPDVIKQMADGGIEALGGGPQDLAALIRTDKEKWAAVVKRAGVQAE